MSHLVNRNSRRGWRGIAALTLAGTTVCLALSFAVNYVLLFSEALTPFGRSMLSAAIIPLIIGIPVFVFIGTKLEDLRSSRRAITRAASHDPLTDCFNGAAFSSLIERRSGQTQPAGHRHGAFLIVEMDRMREINMRYGLAWGDEALKLVAATIRASVRSGDIIGRVNTNEFGVFLPGASEENAVEIGERIRKGVSAAYFAPGGEADMLAVSVGGVVFERELGFEDMFRAAEQLLVDAGPADRLRLSFIDRGKQPPAH